ncbi:MAG: hypothetical protein JST58_13425 [Bacteroidetes bacterium]|nr:hypothetical protein [Bacteroidota bacterium]
MKYIILISFVFLTLSAVAQDILPDANTIVVKKISFIEICNALLDAKYSIAQKDNDLQTLKTELREYPTLWNATYILNIRVKDSVAYITGTVTAPPNGGLFRNEPIYYHTNKKGVPHPKSLFTVGFNIMRDFAKTLNKDTEYIKR